MVTTFSLTFMLQQTLEFNCHCINKTTQYFYSTTGSFKYEVEFIYNHNIVSFLPPLISGGVTRKMMYLAMPPCYLNTRCQVCFLGNTTITPAWCSCCTFHNAHRDYYDQNVLGSVPGIHVQSTRPYNLCTKWVNYLV